MEIKKTIVDQKKTSSENSSQAWWEPAVVLFVRLSVWVAVPVIIGTFLGKFLDRIMGTEPVLLIVAVGLAFVASMVALVKEGSREYKKIEEFEQKRKRERKEIQLEK
jgi:F0F1-type ATP synthase assembly protein I